MYVVHNTTNKTIVLGDLRTEIGPHKILDLENITSRESIDRSHHLQQALSSKILKLVKHSIVETKQIVITDHYKQTNDLKEMIRQTIAQEFNKNDTTYSNLENAVKHVIGQSMKDIQGSIRDQINNLKIDCAMSPEDPANKILQPIINEKELAELQQKSISRISEDIETGGQTDGKKIKIINKNIRDIASEL